MSRISPVILLVIVILAIGFFLLGLLQLLIRCFMKSPSSVSQSNRFPDSASSHTFQRQLQQLFRLHDSGLDQAVIDALPVFNYKEIIGLREPFDCAVCLCELSDNDSLKFLPNCSHAFHIHCIETWLLSNSTCPLCRSTIGGGNPILFNCDDDHSRVEQRNPSCPDERANGSFPSREENAGPSRVYLVRLGKFRSSNQVSESEVKAQNEVVSSSIDDRRCYSMGAFNYVLGETNLQVALSVGNGIGTMAKGQFRKEQLSNVLETHGKKMTTRSRGDSFSVSKIWLWSKKGKFSSSCEENETHDVLHMHNITSLV